eukprot:scaffold259685_cov17-Tisochrysis_lutea.AAC.1
MQHNDGCSRHFICNACVSELLWVSIFPIQGMFLKAPLFGQDTRMKQERKKKFLSIRKQVSSKHSVPRAQKQAGHVKLLPRIHACRRTLPRGLTEPTSQEMKRTAMK